MVGTDKDDWNFCPNEIVRFARSKRSSAQVAFEGTSEPKAQWDITFEEAVQRRAMKKKKKRDPPLEQRVTKLLEEAAAALRTHESALNSLKFAIAELKKKYGFAGISWDDNDNWSLAILRGHIGLLKRTLELYEFPAAAVRSLTIKFVPRGSYMAVNGDAILGADEVPEQWIRTLELVTNSAAVANFIPKMERELSQLLRGLQIKVDLSASAFTYRRQLYQLLERLRTAEAKLRSELPLLGHLWANVVEGTMSLNITVEIRK